MKKIFYILIPVLAVAFVSCSRGQAAKETTAEETTSAIELITHEYVIPEGAEGPGDVPTFADTYNNYPEDKRPKETEASYDIIYYYIGANGMGQDFDSIKGSTCTAEDLMDVLVRGAVLCDGVKVVSYTQNGDVEADLELDGVEPFYEGATEEDVVQAIANTICDNLGVEKVTIKVGDKTYGPLVLDYRKGNKT